MATNYIDPNSDPDLSGAIPAGQSKPASREPKAPAAPQRDPTLSLDLMADGLDALDKLRDQKIKDKTEPVEPTKPAEPAGGNPGGNPDGDKGDPASVVDPSVEGGKKPAPAIPVDDDEVVPGGGKDALGDIKPPEGTSPKTAAAWDSFKAKARAEIDAAAEKAKAVAAEKAALETKVKELEEKAGKAITPEQEKEFAELRRWHAAREVESAPELVSLDSKINANTDTLLAKLKEAGMVEAQLSEIRKVGVTRVNWDELKPHMSSQLRQLVDAKLMQHVNLSEERAETYTKLKATGEEFLKERKAKQEQATRQESEAFDGTARQLAASKPFAFLQDKPVPSDATPEQRKAIEEDNAFAKDMRDSVEQWKTGINTPAMKAELLYGAVMAYRYQRDLKRALAHTKALEAELASEREKFDKVKKASGAGRRTGGATVSAAKPGSDIAREDGTLKSAAEALDELAAPLMNR